jgi:membrane protease YdiL (CAAX protease family)
LLNIIFKNSKIILFVFIYSIFSTTGLFLKFLGIKFSLLGEGVLRLSISLIFSFVIFYVIKTFKIFENYKIDSNSKKLFIFYCFLLLLFILVIGVPNNFLILSKIGVSKFLIVFFNALSAGLFEEFLVRGLCFEYFIDKLPKSKFNLLYSSIISSIIFGFLHISNISMQSTTATMQQIFYASCFGMAFCLIRIFTNGLLIPIFLHFLIDFQPDIVNAMPESSWISLIILFTPLTIFAFICIRNFCLKSKYFFIS